jgi:hypothetical protein
MAGNLPGGGLQVSRLASAYHRLERVAMRWNRQAVPSHRVNPLYIILLEQIHPLCLDRKAIQAKRDLL